MATEPVALLQRCRCPQASLPAVVSALCTGFAHISCAAACDLCGVAAAAGDGFVDRAEFEALYRQLFPAASQEAMGRAFAALDLEGAGRVDIISW